MAADHSRSHRGSCSSGRRGIIFTTVSQAGSVALMTVGSGFLLMSVTGAPIGRVKFSNSELAIMPTRRRGLPRGAADECFSDCVARVRSY